MYLEVVPAQVVCAADVAGESRVPLVVLEDVLVHRGVGGESLLAEFVPWLVVVHFTQKSRFIMISNRNGDPVPLSRWGRAADGELVTDRVYIGQKRLFWPKEFVSADRSCFGQNTKRDIQSRNCFGQLIGRTLFDCLTPIQYSVDR